MLRAVVFSFVLVIQFSAVAHEGFWMPFLLEKNIFSHMQESGCELSPQDIFDNDSPSLKDAVVKIGNGCSGGIISENGLVITNYHCVEYFVQQASSESHNYLDEGLWAHSSDSEVPAPGLHISVLADVVDVTDLVNNAIADTLKGIHHSLRVYDVIDSLTQVYSMQDTTLDYSIEPFYAGNQYFMFSSRVYTDVRLVAAMPASVASFGADKDNWKWPRHAADFAVLRMYADSANKPAAYAPQNKPYVPKKSIQIAAHGSQVHDFTFIMGYPARTNNFSTAHEVMLIRDSLNPLQIALRKLRLQPMKEYMNRGEQERLHYYSDYYSLLNYYEKWSGEQNGIEYARVVEQKKVRENELQSFFKQYNDSLLEVFKFVLKKYNAASDKYYKSYTDIITYVESIASMDFYSFGKKIIAIADTAQAGYVPVSSVRSHVENYTKNSHLPLEKQTFVECMKYISKHARAEIFPYTFRNMSDSQKKHYIQTIADSSLVFNNAVFDSIVYANKVDSLVQIQNIVSQDTGLQFIQAVQNYMSDTLFYKFYTAKFLYDFYKKEYVNLHMQYAQMQNTALSADANGTMRISFGTVEGYTSFDSVRHSPYTTIQGIIDKNSRDSVAYRAHNEFLSFIQQKKTDAQSFDTVYVNFIANNQTTGGSSGSPVFNAQGHMIGLNFDRNMEGTMSDLLYDERICRNIMVDSRYFLFCIEKYANSSYILQELSLVAE
ncbi:MAG: S46 family peptidase [Bacteroidales bacterium]